MKTASAKAKGRKLQQWVRDLLLGKSPDLTTDDIRSTSMGAGGEDILFSSKARELWPFSIECKANARIATYRFMEQAEANCPKGCEPIVVMKEDRGRPMVVVDAQYFFDMQDAINEYHYERKYG